MALRRFTSSHPRSSRFTPSVTGAAPAPIAIAWPRLFERHEARSDRGSATQRGPTRRTPGAREGGRRPGGGPAAGGLAACNDGRAESPVQVSEAARMRAVADAYERTVASDGMPCGIALAESRRPQLTGGH